MSVQPTEQEAIERSVLLTHEVGLHARPSVKLTKLAKRYTAVIAIKPDGREDWTDAKSIVKVMALKAKQGVTLHFKAEGSDAESALDAMVGLVERNFDDDGD
ncbi:MAG: HPr family phosphocarrier protein [Pseudomonadota bacterium]